jgi:hypothetical protein
MIKKVKLAYTTGVGLNGRREGGGKKTSLKSTKIQ